MNQFTNGAVVGWGIDARQENRPGVPMEFDPPKPIGNPPYQEPPAQTAGTPTAKDPARPLTAVFGTATPLRGLSGLLRRAAYRIPPYKARRWMMLVLADRVDVVEHNVMPLAALAGVVAVSALALRALRR